MDDLRLIDSDDTSAFDEIVAAFAAEAVGRVVAREHARGDRLKAAAQTAWLEAHAAGRAVTGWRIATVLAGAAGVIAGRLL